MRTREFLLRSWRRLYRDRREQRSLHERIAALRSRKRLLIQARRKRRTNR